MRRLLVLLVCVAAVTGCVYVNTTLLGTTKQRSSVPPDSVVIYRTTDQVPRKYEEVALLIARQDASWTREAGMLRKMQKEAGKLGANGVILDAIRGPSFVEELMGFPERKGRAIAIYIMPAAPDSVANR